MLKISNIFDKDTKLKIYWKSLFDVPNFFWSCEQINDLTMRYFLTNNFCDK